MTSSQDRSPPLQVRALQHWPGTTADLGFVAIPAPSMLPTEYIDQIAELTVKRMPDGLTGFTRIWGWQQYAQALLDAFQGSVITYGHNLLDAQVHRLGGRAEFDRWIRRDSPAGCIADMLRGWKACADSLASSVYAPTQLAEGHVACLSCDWTGPVAGDCPMCGGETGSAPPTAQGLPAIASRQKAMTDLLREIVAYCRESGHSWSSLDEADALLSLVNRRSLLPGWRFEQCGDGSILIDGPTSAVVCSQVAKADRKVPEEVLWELAHALLAENILGQGKLLDPPMPDAAPIKVAIPQGGDGCRVTMEFSSPQEAEAFRQFFAQHVPVPDHKKWPPIPLSHCNPAQYPTQASAQLAASDASLYTLQAWRDEVMQLSMIAGTAMHQDSRDQRNILEDLAERLSMLSGRMGPLSAQPQWVVSDADEAKHADAHLRALLRYTEGFYSSAVEHGMKAATTANAVAHVERAAKALHMMVHSLCVQRSASPAQPQGAGVAVGPTIHGTKPSREITLYNGETDEPYIDIDGSDLWCNATDFSAGDRKKIRWIVEAANWALQQRTAPPAAPADGRGTDAQIEKEREIARHAIVGALAAGYAGQAHPGADHWLAAAHEAGVQIKALEAAGSAAPHASA